MIKYVTYSYRTEICTKRMLNGEHCCNVWNPEVDGPAGCLERIYIYRLQKRE
jgi:hypothetical protein